MARKHRKKGSDCPNCGTPLRPEFEFCPHCGQENHDLRVPFRMFVYEFVESITHFDTKVWNTLKVIFTKPGQLTKDFAEGKRARYVHPSRFYVFVSVVFFALLAWTIDREVEEAGATSGRGMLSAKADLEDMLPDSVVKALLSDSLILSHISLPIDSPWYAPMRARLQNNAALIDSLVSAEDVDTVPGVRRRLLEAMHTLPATSQLDVQRWVKAIGLTVTFPNREEEQRFLRVGANMTDAQADSLITTDTDEESTWLKRRAIRSLGRLQVGSIKGTQNLAHLVVRSVSVIMFILMPFTAVLLLWIFFRRRYYWEHLIFSVHIHTIYFLFLIIALLLEAIIPGGLPDIVNLLLVLFCWGYLLLSLRRVYQRGWLATIARMLFMGVPYLLVFLFLFMAGAFWGFLSL